MIYQATLVFLLQLVSRNFRAPPNLAGLFYAPLARIRGMVQQPGIHEGWLIVPFGRGLVAIPLWLAAMALIFVVGCIAAVWCAITFGKRRVSSDREENPWLARRETVKLTT